MCRCLGVDNEAQLEISREYISKYNEVISKLVSEFNGPLVRRNTRFVAQPFMIHTHLASDDLISKADCFHPSAAGQGFLGRGLWINLFEPVGKKRDRVAFDELVCPTEQSIVGV